jgi:DNA helicase-2/ATP-dependent DNA helicase PcrA
LHPLIAKLNPEQRAAVETTDGPLLILAGAGSGKTRVITNRIAWLIQEKGVAPDSILAVTFTNKASKEMGERVDKLLDHGSLAKPLIATFHSLCVRILRRDVEALRIGDKGLTRSFAIFDESDQQNIVKQIMRRMGIDTKQLTPRTVLSRISWAKNHMVDPQESFLSSKDPNGERIAHIYKSYQAELLKNNAMDFDDLLTEAVRLLKSSAEVRARYQHRYRYLLVDEYQDTNRPQYELMKLLAGERHNVCAVGDEDQSIYSWRGADINNILGFEKDFPNARIIRLEQNYRSTQVILEAAGAVVANNLRRKGKKLWTDRQGGSLIGYYEAPDGENEALFIADRIKTYLRQASASENAEPGGQHCAVLYRTNAQSRLVEEALRRYNISYTMVGGFSFYDRAEIKDLLSYLRLVRNPHDSMALQRVINTPVRGIGKTSLETLERLALETGVSTWEAIGSAIKNRLLPGRALMAIDTFRQLIVDAQTMMDPDFAGKLSASAAEAEDADTDFSFGAADDGAEQQASSAQSGTVNETFANANTESGHDFSRAESVSEKEGASAPEGTDSNTSFNFGGHEDQMSLLNMASFNPFAEEPKHPFLQAVKRQAAKSAGKKTEVFAASSAEDPATEVEASPKPDFTAGFRKPGDAATLPELIRFLIDRSGYIKALETEATPEATSRIENLKELANAAHDAEVRGESLADFLDHAALASDTDQINPDARVTLMTLHAAKGLEFPLVFLTGLEEGLFPHSRTFQNPEELEEERRLCYVGMTRAMNTLIITRAEYRRRYGNDSPERTIPSRFLEEVPSQLMENLAGQNPASSASAYGSGYGGYTSRKRSNFGGESEGRHFNYEDESQEYNPAAPAAAHGFGSSRKADPSKPFVASWMKPPKTSSSIDSSAVKPDESSIDNIARFFGGQTGVVKPGALARPASDVPKPHGAANLQKGQRVRHAKYGDGTVLIREGEGEDAKLTVMFTRHGMKKLIEKFANLQKI